MEQNTNESEEKFTLPEPEAQDAKPTLWTKCKKALLQGWYQSGDEQSHNRACQLGYSYTSNIITNLTGNNFYTGLMLLLNADDSFIGLMGIFTYAANTLQCLAPLLLERFASRKKLLISMRLVMFFFNIVSLGLVPLLPAGEQMKLTLFGLGVLLVQLCSGLMTPGYNIWHLQFLPPQVRVKFFSLQSVTTGVIVALVNLGGSYVVDVCKATGSELLGLSILRIVALAVAAVDILLLCKMKEYPYERSTAKLTLKDLLIKPFKEKAYLRTIGITFTWALAAYIPGSYYTVYLLKDLQVSYSFITLVSMLNVPVLLLCTPLWTKLLKRVSWLKTLNLGILAYAPHFILLGLVNIGNAYVLYPAAMLYAFVLLTGINLCFNNVPYINIPKHDQTVFFGFLATITNFGALLGVAIGRELVGVLSDVKLTVGSLVFGDKQIMVFIVAGMIALAALAVKLLRKGVNENG